MEEIKISDIIKITGGISDYTDDVFVTGVQTVYVREICMSH